APKRSSEAMQGPNASHNLRATCFTEVPLGPSPKPSHWVELTTSSVLGLEGHTHTEMILTKTRRGADRERKLVAKSSETRRRADLTESERNDNDSDGDERKQRWWRVTATAVKTNDCNDGGKEKQQQ
ncbi:hypothetical protein BHE74_00027383, partial [Ensete ventricosum]